MSSLDVHLLAYSLLTSNSTKPFKSCLSWMPGDTWENSLTDCFIGLCLWTIAYGEKKSCRRAQFCEIKKRSNEPPCSHAVCYTTSILPGFKQHIWGYQSSHILFRLWICRFSKCQTLLIVSKFPRTECYRWLSHCRVFSHVLSQISAARTLCSQTKANVQLPLAKSLVHIVYKMKYSTVLNHLTGSDWQTAGDGS